MPESGWYEPPDEPGIERWWDGEQWTDHRREPQTQATTDTTDTRSWYQKKRFLIPGGLLLLVFIIAGITGDLETDTEPVASDAPTESAEATEAAESEEPEEPEETADPAPEEPEPEPEPEPTEESNPAEEEYESFTVSQQNAVDSALSYLEFQSFSRSGLIEQLEFEGYPNADAEGAVAFVEKWGLVDWMEQAAKSAESYMEFQSFSRSGLIEQLEFEGFTREQAEHGADSVGL